MTPPIVNASQLSKTYAEQTVVKDITFRVEAGECCGILGPNGAGKTTTLRMLTGNTPPTSGSLEVLGEPIPARARHMRARLGIVPQQDNLDPDFSVRRNLEVYGEYFGLGKAELAQRIERLLDFAALTHKANAQVPALSGGMQRRLSLARALINEPDLLVLDEPTTGLDPQARQLIWQRLRDLKKRGLSLILTSHYMEEAERLCDRLIIMDNGQILEQGTPRELIKRYIEPQVVEIHDASEWYQQHGQHLNCRHERVGDTVFFYAADLQPVLAALPSQISYLHRPANLEDVFLTLTGRDLRDG